MNNSESRQLYNRLYQQFALRELYIFKHSFDNHAVGLNWSELLKYTRKFESPTISSGLFYINPN